MKHQHTRLANPAIRRASRVASRVASLCLLLVCCDFGPRFYDCDEDGLYPLQVVKTEWPAAAEVADRVDWFCKPRDELDYDVDAYTYWYGSACARARVHSDVEISLPAAVAHEGRHWFLYISTEDDCPSHAETCGFDYEEVERVTDIALNP